MEGIDHVARAVDADADQEMRGKGQALGLPALAAGDVEIEDRQRHRQALAPLDDAHEVGVLQVVVGLGVAAIAVGARDHLGERLGRGAAAAHQVGEVGRHRRDMLAERREIDRLAATQHAQRQRRLEQVETLSIAGAKIAEPRQLLQASAIIAHRHHSGARQTSGRWRGQSPPTSTASKRTEWAA